jgi:hypothetical protein
MASANEEDFVMKRLINAVASTVLAGVAISGLALMPASAQANRVKVGTLSCDISAGLGFIVASQKQVRCMFTPSAPGPREAYFGTITKVGVDLGATGGGELVWNVYAPTSRRFGALAGHYVGTNAEASVGVGGGANFLVGGSNRTITLQPFSVQGQTGLNLAVAVASLDLERIR